MKALDPLPTQGMYDTSKQMRCDNYYALPKIIECFLERANGELPFGWHVKPWTLNRAVTIFRGSTPVGHIDYDRVERNIVEVLDWLPGFVERTPK